MTGCSEYKMLIQKFLDREISPGERTILEQHLSLCGGCEREFEAIQSGLEMMILMNVPEPGADFTFDTVKKALKAKKEQDSRRKIASWSLSVLIGLISLLMVAVWSMVFQSVMQRVLLSAIQGLSQASTLLTVFNKTVSAMSSLLWTLGSVIYKIVCSGCSPGFIFLASLLVMIFSMFLTRGKDQLFLFNRR